jgi:capsular exopolysaccharide synthesis family protein
MRASSQIRFVETAEPPNRPFSPKLTLNLAFGLVSGLMAGLGLVWFDDYSNQRLRSPSESEMVLRLPQLGCIPPASGRNALETRPDRKLFARVRRALPGGAPAQDENLPPVAVGWIDARRNGGGNRRIAEAFHGVVASVLASLRNSGGSRVLMVTSAFEGDGKTTVTSQLACALAEVGHKVLLIDGDMRAPSLHTVFGLPNDLGLSGMFTAPALREDFFEPSGEGDAPNYIRRTKVERLDLLAAGTPPKSAVITLHSPRLGEIISRQRTRYDFVIVDTPPMMQVSDARILGRHADAAIIVLRSGKTPRGAALTVKRRLADDRLPVLGTILNGWEPGQGSSSYYYG